MKRIMILCLAAAAAWTSLEGGEARIGQDVLRDKIRGGWTGQVIGCTFGGPTEFRYQGAFIQDYQPLDWSGRSIPWSFRNAPGLYDDVYMELAFLRVLDREGIKAPASSLAKAFAEAPFPLWHANQAARYNILHGLKAPDSGHWLNNPHADDIDFEIEADFAGLLTPGMVGAALDFCRRAGRIMNSGDGWYGGVYMAAMYSLAFVSDDVERVVEEGLRVVPPRSAFAAAMRDVIAWHKEYPDDWKETWFRVQKKWSEDIGCPEGVFSSFNIDAKINSAWVLLGLLYGDGDFGKTLSISTRCGDDSDCNPASAAGILGTILGYSRIPGVWKEGLAEVEKEKFPYTDLSLAEVYDLTFRIALQVVRAKGGKIESRDVLLPLDAPPPLPLEKNFEGHYPTEKRRLSVRVVNEFSFDFEGVGFVLDGESVRKGGKEAVLKAELQVDGKTLERAEFPTDFLRRRTPLFWRYRLADGKHHVRLKVLSGEDKAGLALSGVVIYRAKPPRK